MRVHNGYKIHVGGRIAVQRELLKIRSPMRTRLAPGGGGLADSWPQRSERGHSKDRKWRCKDKT